MAGRAALINEVHERVEGLTRTQAAAIEEALGRGEAVTIPGFGRFSVARREAQEGRNPRVGSAIRISSSLTVRFRSPSDLEAAPPGRDPAPASRGAPEPDRVDLRFANRMVVRPAAEAARAGDWRGEVYGQTG